MELYWSWLIVIYLFLGGLGAGAYLTSYTANKGWLGKSPALVRAGYFMASPIVAIGTVLLVFDLGQGLKKPWLLIGLLKNLQSVMTWGVYILASFIIVGLIVAFCVFKKRSIPKVLEHLGAILALATCAYTGLLIAVVEAIPVWNSYLMPVLFVISALSTGLSITVLVSHWLDKGLDSDELKITKLHLGLISAEIIVLAIFIITMLSGSKGAIGIASVEKILSGSLAIPFWGILVALGLICPLVIFIIGYKRIGSLEVAYTPQAPEAMVSDKVIAIKGEHGVENGVKNAVLLADVFVIMGGMPQV